MYPDIHEAISSFRFEGTLQQVIPYGDGHINDTYLACFQRPDGSTQHYILQRINHHVFQDPPSLMRNVHLVTKHLREKVQARGGDPARQALTLIPTVRNDFLHYSAAGNYWRGLFLIDGARTYQVAENAHHVYNAGKAFGDFQWMLCDFPANELRETIPNFHHTPKRFAAFQDAVAKDSQGRASQLRSEIDFVRARAGDLSRVVDLLAAGELPLRVTHNDTKFNNVLIDEFSGDWVCVIDLDTVMPGAALYDFGDAIRSITNTGEEDERDLDKVHFSLELYEHFTRGFLEGTHGMLCACELELMPFSARLMTLECGMRFLSDHLNGDVYFKVHHPDHNLDRTRTQFRLVQEMEEKMEEMGAMVRQYA